jgi:hypothetical protein
LTLSTERRKAGALEPGRVLDRLGNHRLSIERIVAKVAQDPAGDPERLLRGQDQARLNRASSF